MVKAKVGSKEYEKKVKACLSEGTDPCGVGYIARTLSIGFATARAILQELLLEGKIQGQKTTFGWIFWLEKKQSKEVVQNASSIDS